MALRWNSVKRMGVVAVVLFAFLGWCRYAMLGMPGESYRGQLPPLGPAQAELRVELREAVRVLAGEIGPRNVFRPEAYAAAEAYLAGELDAAGWSVERQEFEARGSRCANLVVELPGSTRAGEIVVVGAHYDSCLSTPGADDNASGAAAVVALARRLGGRGAARTLRLALFANEEPPFFRTDEMGSLRYARRCRDRGDDIVAMLSLEMLGYYSVQPGSQSYPPFFKWAYPDTADFIAFAGNWRSRALVRSCVRTFRENVPFPCEGAALPGWVAGVGLSDNWSFWRAGYPALMVTDTSFFRYPHYHALSDTPEKLDYERMARVVDGLERVIGELIDVDG